MTFITRKKTPPTPSPEEFVSPLREELKAQLAVKPDIGYNKQCACCRAHQTVDKKIELAVKEKEDPQPWLEEIHTELVDTQKELVETRRQLQDAKNFYTPQNRMKWAAYGALASGIATSAVVIGRYVTEWAIQNIHNYLPWLIHLLLVLVT